MKEIIKNVRAKIDRSQWVGSLCQEVVCNGSFRRRELVDLSGVEKAAYELKIPQGTVSVTSYKGPHPLFPPVTTEICLGAFWTDETNEKTQLTQREAHQIITAARLKLAKDRDLLCG